MRLFPVIVVLLTLSCCSDKGQNPKKYTYFSSDINEEIDIEEIINCYEGMEVDLCDIWSENAQNVKEK